MQLSNSMKFGTFKDIWVLKLKQKEEKALLGTQSNVCIIIGFQINTIKELIKPLGHQIANGRQDLTFLAWITGKTGELSIMLLPSEKYRCG